MIVVKTTENKTQIPSFILLPAKTIAHKIAL